MFSSFSLHPERKHSSSHILPGWSGWSGEDPGEARRRHQRSVPGGWGSGGVEPELSDGDSSTSGPAHCHRETEREAFIWPLSGIAGCFSYLVIYPLTWCTWCLCAAEWIHSPVHGRSGESPGRGAIPPGERRQPEHRHGGEIMPWAVPCRHKYREPCQWHIIH